MNDQTAQLLETPQLPRAEMRISVAGHDLPICCPRPETALWNAHPRVYLPLSADPGSQAICPYCGTRFIIAQ